MRKVLFSHMSFGTMVVLLLLVIALFAYLSVKMNNKMNQKALPSDKRDEARRLYPVFVIVSVLCSGLLVFMSVRHYHHTK